MIRRRAKRDPKPAKKRKRRRSQPAQLETVPETETVPEAMAHIAQDAVLILRRGLAFHAERVLRYPSAISVTDCVALLRMTTELGAAAKQGAQDEAQQADYSRLSPAERVQLAALLLKVDYA